MGCVIDISNTDSSDVVEIETLLKFRALKFETSTQDFKIVDFAKIFQKNVVTTSELNFF